MYSFEVFDEPSSKKEYADHTDFVKICKASNGSDSFEAILNVSVFADNTMQMDFIEEDGLAFAKVVNDKLNYVDLRLTANDWCQLFSVIYQSL